MTDTAAKPYLCPRRAENPASATMFPGGDTIRADGTCSYCGSLSADVFMAGIESGDVELGPTDKSYKVYVDMPEPDADQLVIRGSSNVEKRPGDNWHRVGDIDASKIDTRGWSLHADNWYLVEPRGAVRHAKFYFQHLSREQQDRFIELHNEKRLRIGYPGRFYVRPFFCGVAAQVVPA